MDPYRYQAEARRTLSGSYHGQKVTMAELRQRIEAAIKTGEALDQVKKALFYGKGNDIGLTNGIGMRNAIEAPFLIAGVPIPMLTVDLTEAERKEVKTAEILLHMALGKVTEACEFLEAVAKAMNGETQLDRTNLLEEIGDGLWYDGNALTELESSFFTEMGRNNDKLRTRFPDKFTEAQAIDRDLDAERATLEAMASDPHNDWPVSINAEYAPDERRPPSTVEAGGCAPAITVGRVRCPTPLSECECEEGKCQMGYGAASDLIRPDNG